MSLLQTLHTPEYNIITLSLSTSFKLKSEKESEWMISHKNLNKTSK